ncbi:hypothetical protein EJ110_NYTH14992 [Nymphaea thermarum]|nr:hypothetical protein EJ110_NYTH14992 [Nymphaea thermarum]
MPRSGDNGLPFAKEICPRANIFFCSGGRCSPPDAARDGLAEHYRRSAAGDIWRLAAGVIRRQQPASPIVEKRGVEVSQDFSSILAKGDSSEEELSLLDICSELKELRGFYGVALAIWSSYVNGDVAQTVRTRVEILPLLKKRTPLELASRPFYIIEMAGFEHPAVLSLPDIYSQPNSPILKDLLDAFQISGTTDDILFSIRSSPSYGNIDYPFCDDYSFFYSLGDIACSSSFSLASEVLVALQSIVNSIQMFIDKLSERIRKNCIGFVMGILPTLQDKLGALAQRLLEYDWDCQFHDGDWRSSGKILQKILHIHITNAQPVQGLLSELACTILPQVPSYKAKNKQDSVDGLPTLCPATLVTWYHELHEENLGVLNKLLKEVGLLQNSKTINKEMVATLLEQIQVSVDIVVSLVSMCKTHDKIHFVVHNAVILQMIKELQRATRTIQTLCSEAKVSRRIMITSKIPYTKRMMERFLFNVKALFHSTSNGCSFWMGNLKHKDLSGQVVNSQAYDDNEDGNNTQTPFSQMAADSEDVRGSQGLQET